MSRFNSSQSMSSESTALLGGHGRGSGKRSPGLIKGMKKHMAENIDKDWADLILLFCYVITGLLDSSAVFIWGSFASMQTGNTVYLGLGLVAPSEDNRWIKALTSISFFCLGSYFFSRLHHHMSPRARWVLVLSYSLQLLLILGAALIVTLGSNTSNQVHWQVIAPLAAVAFQASGQVVVSRVLQHGPLTSVVLTSNYCDLFADTNLLAAHNVDRNRRIAAPILLLLGAMCGGMFAHSLIGMAGALWTAVIFKAMVVLAWFFWKADPKDHPEDLPYNHN